jgi:hypothetical protein
VAKAAAADISIMMKKMGFHFIIEKHSSNGN